MDMPAGQIPFTVQVKPLSIGGDYVRYQVGWKGQLRCMSPASCFVLADVQ